MDILPLEKIIRDGGIQQRNGGLKQARVREYAGAMKRGDHFPPVTVFHNGKSYWLSDGFHRCAATEAIGLLEIEVEIKAGTQRDALLYAIGANAAHGIRRTNADKRKVVLTLLEDEEWQHWSDHEIARRTHTTQPFVSKLRREVASKTMPSPRQGVNNLKRLDRAWKNASAAERLRWLEQHLSEIRSLLTNFIELDVSTS